HSDEVLDKVGRCWGIAADDAHDAQLDCYHAWLMVKAEQLELPHILDALRAGAYYCTQGPEFRDLRLEPYIGGEGRAGARQVAVETSPAASITILANRSRGRRFVAPPGETLTHAEYPILG